MNENNNYRYKWMAYRIISIIAMGFLCVSIIVFSRFYYIAMRSYMSIIVLTPLSDPYAISIIFRASVLMLVECLITGTLIAVWVMGVLFSLKKIKEML